MAVVARITCWHMSGRFTGSCRAVMAADAATDHGRMIDSGNRCPAAAAMAILAEIGGRNVSGTLARRGYAIVTAGTASTDIAVIEHSGGPAAGVVAVVAGIATGDVGRCLAGCNAAVMAAGTAPEYRAVVDTGHRQPAAAAMAVFTKIGGLNVAARFSSGGSAVMTARAAASHCSMIEARGRPTARTMTGITLGCGLHMGSCLAWCRAAIVAAGTAADD